jgi:hypothetical protein
MLHRYSIMRGVGNGGTRRASLLRPAHGADAAKNISFTVRPLWR